MYVWLIVTIVLLSCLALWRWRFNFHWFDFWFGLGKLGRLAKDSNCERGSDWSDSEKTLCDGYKQFIHYPDQTEFENCADYLHLAQDGGRRLTPAWMLTLLVILVIAESMGFSYMLGTYLAMEGSENLHVLLMVGIVIVFAVIMPLVTHFAGHQLYRTNLINQNKKKRGASRGEGGEISSAKLQDSQEIDSHQPSHTRCLNRVGENGGYFALYSAVILIIAIAVLSTWMRISHLEKAETQDTMGVAPVSAGSKSGNPYSTGSPPSELTQPQAEANNNGNTDKKKAGDQEGLAAFIMLAVLFVVTQAVGIGAGYKFGFAGQYSKDAYEGTRGFSTYRRVRDYYKPRIKIVNDRLKNLQQKMRQNGAPHTVPLNKSFEDWLALDGTGSENSTPNPAMVASPAAVSSISIQSSSASQTEIHLAKISSMGNDKEAKKKYINELPQELRVTVTAELKLRKAKEEEVKLARQDQELDDIL